MHLSLETKDLTTVIYYLSIVDFVLHAVQCTEIYQNNPYSGDVNQPAHRYSATELPKEVSFIAFCCFVFIFHPLTFSFTKYFCPHLWCSLKEEAIREVSEQRKSALKTGLTRIIKAAILNSS